MTKIYEVVTLDEVIKAINPEYDLAFDTETVGKYGKIRLAQFYQRHWDKALLVDSPPIFDLFAFLVSQSRSTARASLSLNCANIVMRILHNYISCFKGS